MKRVISLILTAIVAVSITSLFGCDGCSCIPENVTSYYPNYWSENLSIGQSETCVYDVTYKTDFNEDGFDYRKNDSIGANVSVQDGTYAVTTSIINKSELPNGSKVDDDFNGNFIKITTDLSLTVKYSISSQVFNDKVTSEVYFYDHSYGYSPIYSHKNYSSSSLMISSNSKADKILWHVYETTTTYDKDDAYFTIKQNEFPTDAGENVLKQTVTEKTNYKASGDFKKYIDNESLLFASRVLNYDKSNVIKVFSPSYLEVEKVDAYSIKNGSTSMALSINDSFSENVTTPYTRVALIRSDDTYSGSAILVDLQNGELTINGSTFADKNYIVKMTTRLPAFSGALVYTLKTVNN